MPVTLREVTLARLSNAAYTSGGATGLPTGFVPVTAAQLGYSPIGGESFADGVFRNGNAQAIVTVGSIGGQRTLVLAFTGSNDREDSLNDLRGINADWPDFARLVAAVDATIANAQGGLKLAVTGHSLGGALTQLFMATHPDASIVADTFGSPGAQIEDGPDPRTLNVVIADDPAVWLGENRAEVGAALRDNPVLAGAAAIVAGTVFPGLTVADALRTLGDIRTDYENRGETLVLAGAAGTQNLISGIQQVLGSDPVQHDIGLYLAKVDAAYDLTQGMAPEPVIAWQNTGGAAALWKLSGIAVTGGGVVANPGAGWTLADTGDFNADARTDLLWRNADGSAAIWQLNGTAITGGGLLGNPGNSWAIRGSADFDGDTRSDVLWQNTDGSVAIWQVQGASVTGGGVVGNPGAAWTVVGAADVNGDGRADILWRNADGTVAAWEMNGTAVIGGGLVGAVGTDWTVAGAADVQGDGKADLVWRGPDGTVVVWLMDGEKVIGGGAIGQAGLDWAIKAFGDYDGDDRAEILFRNQTTGGVVAWDTDGTQVTGGGVVASAGADWNVVA